MARFTERTVKKLFALSGNVCAFPGCQLQIIGPGDNIMGEICHIKARSIGGPRFDPALSHSERNDYVNLILLCRYHHRLVDSDPVQWTTAILEQMKAARENALGRAERPQDRIAARRLIDDFQGVRIGHNSGNISVNSPGAIQAQTIHIRTSKRPVVNPPPGTIGADQNASRYVRYLINRYNRFAGADYSRNTVFSFGAISRNLVTNFGSEWRLLPLEKATDVFEYLQARIGKTRVGKANAAKGQHNAANYEEFTVGQPSTT